MDPFVLSLSPAPPNTTCPSDLNVDMVQKNWQTEGAKASQWGVQIKSTIDLLQFLATFLM